jgi:acyl carrier protein
MKTSDFLEELQDLLQREEPLEPEMRLKELPEWDSLSLMAIAAFFDKHFRQSLTFNDFERLTTVRDLLDQAGLKE